MYLQFLPVYYRPSGVADRKASYLLGALVLCVPFSAQQSKG